MFKDTSIFQKAQSNHNLPVNKINPKAVQRYFNFSKSAIKSQQLSIWRTSCRRSKILQFFKKRNQITTCASALFSAVTFKDTSIFQKAQSNHNRNGYATNNTNVQRYFNFSKSAIKSQLTFQLQKHHQSSKILQFFKKRNQITTVITHWHFIYVFKDTSIFQKAQSNHNCCHNNNGVGLVQRYFNFSKSAIKSQLLHGCLCRCRGSKILQFFKKRNQITTSFISAPK